MIPDRIDARPTQDGGMWVFGVNSNGHGFGFPIDPMVLAESAPRIAFAAVNTLRGHVHTDHREPRDDQRGQENVS